MPNENALLRALVMWPRRNRTTPCFEAENPNGGCNVADGIEIRGRHLSYQRSRHVTNPGTSLIKIEGVDDTNAANFYLGKKVAYVYRGQKEIRGSKIRVIWGKVTRPHGKFISSKLLAPRE
ncbi:60S ribosomal protein L33B [Conoideocrella luteorostrata]|uniref:60S ribosomal protein L33B n=1 Tax=Conoideocrella luteorostrata TaxID=1105319 RepID=A0AAJ0FPD1_9HYPO|nr:60S ribosomal protein L33B [Conoideocrella luteorostrata]